MIHAAAEVGGTFTDIIWTDASGQIHTHKVPTTNNDPSEGVIAGLREALGPHAEEMDRFCHGSTVATNAVIERKGSRALFVATRGFGDVLVLQRQLRDNVYAIVCTKPQPLIPLRRTVEASERIAADGSVIAPLDEGALLRDLDAAIAEHAPEAVAVCLLHSWCNGAHERRIGELLRARYPGLTVVLSCEVLPAFREYERASTTAMAAYLVPLVGRYLSRLGGALADMSATAHFFIMQSSGGMLPSEGARQRGVEMLNSGPAAGVIGVQKLAARVGDRNLITLDVGGTSADVCLIASGQPGLTAESAVDGLPVGLPTIDISNVGAGGGSIAWLDAGGMLQVGPRSAGARPGPACYGHGGRDPTLTDALVRLGWIRPQGFLGGRMPLYPDRAEAALAGLADRLGSTPAALAQAIVDIAAAHVSRCVRMVSVQRGHDPKDYALYAYGGAGPVIAALAAEELRIGRVVIPPHPGLFSAVGLLVADLRRVYRETEIMAVTAVAVTRVAEVFGRLRAAAEAEFAGYGHDPQGVEIGTGLEMRYVGQGFELLVPVALDRLAAEGEAYLRAMFHAAHRTRYGTSAPTDRIEIVTFRLVAQVPGDSGILARMAPTAEPARGKGPGEGRAETAEIVFRGMPRACRFIERRTLGPGARIDGCCVIEEPTATTLVPPGWTATPGEAGALILQAEERT